MSIGDGGGDERIPRSLSPLARLRAARNNKSSYWAAGWAVAGAAVWAGLAVLARMGIARIGVIELVFLFAPLVIVPLGMELGRVRGASLAPVGRWLEQWAQVLQPLGAVLAALAMLLPPGKWAGVAASGWAVVCTFMGASGIAELGKVLADRSVRPTRVAEIAAAVARIDLGVGGAWLVASRLGMRPMGIQEPVGLLTAVHFHFAGFATAKIASATARHTTGDGRWLGRVVLLVVGMPFLVAAGFVISPILKMVAGVTFSASVAGLAGFVWKSKVDRRARGFLRAAAGAVFVGVLLAGAYAVADFAGSEALPIPRMASTHGILNGFGFCLLGLLGWLVEGERGDSARVTL